MNITKKIIITDTNILTDLNNANILEDFVKLDNVYISDMVKNDEVNCKSGNVKLISKIKVIFASSEQLIEVSKLSFLENKLSTCDLLCYVIARDNSALLATGDNRLKVYSEKNGVEVIRTLRIIKLLREKNIISIEKAINACVLIKECPSTRIPINEINKLLRELQKYSLQP